jgi:L-histidine Nalpha-methyltransferase
MVATKTRVDVTEAPEEALTALREDVRRGLTSRPRSLPPKYFYDRQGTRLFEAITRLPEYYLARTEMAILREHADEIAAEAGASDLVELGPGASEKSRLILDAMARAGTLESFRPLDISADAVERTVQDLTRAYRGLRIQGLVGDFARTLDRIPPGGRRLVAFLGSTLGNLDRQDAVSLMGRIARLLKKDDLFLLGTDLVKPTPVLEAAYNDAAGITARFNRNILRVINRELGADFRPRLFDHHAFFRADLSRIEMHLRARRAHEVRIADLAMAVAFEAGELLHTENSHKYTRGAVTSMLHDAGLELRRWFVDEGNVFALSLSGTTA